MHQLFEIASRVYARREEIAEVVHDEDNEVLNRRNFTLSIDSANENRGDIGVKSLTNFTYDEFNGLYELIQEGFHREGRGKTFPLNSRQMLYLTLFYLRNYPKITVFESLMGKSRLICIEISDSSLHRMIFRTVEVIKDKLYSRYFDKDKVRIGEIRFDNFPMAIAACDVSLLPIHHNVDIATERQHYSGKHKRCGIKLQACVSPEGLCIDYYDKECGRVHDKMVFDKSETVRKLQYHQTNFGVITTCRYPMLFDRGYIGVNNAAYPEAIVQKRAPRGGELSDADKHFNDTVQHDRVIVENYFGRMKTLWIILQDTFRGTNHSLRRIAEACVILTNYHIELHPLRREDARSDEADYETADV